MNIGDRFTPQGIFKGVFIADCIKRNKNLSSTDKLVWGQLNQYSGSNGKCYPKQDEIADEIGVSSRSVRTSLDRLEEFGFISIENPTGFDRVKHLHNQYYFTWNELYELALKGNVKQKNSGEENISGLREENISGLREENISGAKNRIIEKDNIKENPLSVTEENSAYVLLANQLSRIVRRHYPKDILTDKKINDWVAPIKKIFKDSSGSPDELKEWLKLYYIHHDPKNRYHPVIRSGKGLLERMKGGQLERFVNTITQPVKQYSNKSKGVSDHILHPSDFKPSDNSYDDILKDKTIRYTNS